MKLAFCTISALDRPLEAAAAAALSAGLDGLEVTARPPHLDPEAGPEAARGAARAVHRAGLEVTAYGSYLGHPGCTAPEHVNREVAIAGVLETGLLRVWAPPLPGGEAGDDRTPVLDWLRRACDAAAPLGIDVVVERHVGSFADTPERTERLLNDVDRDNLALNYQVLDFLPPDQAGAQADDCARLIVRARYVHLKNYRSSPEHGGRLVHGASLEGGLLDYRSILGAALEAGYEGPMAFEFLSADDRPLEDRLGEDAAFVRRVLADRGAA